MYLLYMYLGMYLLYMYLGMYLLYMYLGMYLLYMYIFTFFGSGIADGQHDTGRQRGQGAFLLEPIL
jgi:hypothetical protein